MEMGKLVNEKQPKANRYSSAWFEVFLTESDLFSSQTQLEVDFLKRILPYPDVTSVLDLCCGYGRHAIPMAEAGHRVLGIDRDPNVIAGAQSFHHLPNLEFRVHDMTALNTLPEMFDAVVCMWQSFGYFDEATNIAILTQMSEHLYAGGRVVLDIYNKEFFAQRQGTRETQQRGETIVTTQVLENDRLIVSLNYLERKDQDVFSWQMYTPQSITQIAERCGLKAILICSDFNEEVEPSSEKPRMQLVFEKR